MNWAHGELGAVLIWINGPFGGGKTQTAHELNRRLPGSVLCDPESVGFGLHRMMPKALREDFQHLRSWRAGVVEVLDLVLRKHNGPVLAPMTLIREDYFAEIIGVLRASGHDVRHFTLLASRETVLRRLSERGLGRLVQFVAGAGATLKHETFAVRMLDECLERLAAPQFAEHLHTDTTPIEAVADHIAAACGLALTPADPSRVQARLRRAVVGLRHIRIGA
ncbi:AAA family ATPase [Labedaea rhizosphaerae]|uniref:AAA domain-containing protein n=1 Tax=Labedaea rhizosphaerae TaxID=598644 RepID=A0A4R6S2X9_LABRH|nr:AAA family ATPase [Labedaea rhizosphaerae]TDP93653.1 AAA domain-containing protein [Labedaea rhizosphaerae]